MANKAKFITTTELRSVQKSLDKAIKYLTREVQSLTKKMEKFQTSQKKSSKIKKSNVTSTA